MLWYLEILDKNKDKILYIRLKWSGFIIEIGLGFEEAVIFD